MLGFGSKNKTRVSQEDVHSLLTQFKDVHPLEARKRIRVLRKSATRDSKHFLNILEVANGILYFARRREKAVILDILQKGKPNCEVMDAVAVQLARENPYICRWLLLDVIYGDCAPYERAVAAKEVERVIDELN